MVSVDCQITSLAIMTIKHNSHDCCWLVQGVSTALFCFACAIESLEDYEILSVRKKNILMELLEILIRSDQLWKALLDKHAVCTHSIKLFVHLLSANTDAEYSKLVIECVLLFVMRTNPHSSGRAVVTAVLQSQDFLKCFGFVSLLARLGPVVGSCADIFLTCKPPIVDNLLAELGVCDPKFACPMWEFLGNLLADALNCGMLQPKLAKVLLDMLLDAYQSSPVHSIKPTLLSVLSTVVKFPSVRQMVLHNEISELTPKSRSVTELLKRALLSTTEDMQITAVNIVLSLCEAFEEIEAKECSKLAKLSLSGVLVEKGVCEFMFELLSSKSEVLLRGLLACLQIFIACEEFFSKGYYIFGAVPVIDALTSAINRREIICSGLKLLNKLFEESSRRSFCLLASDKNVSKLITMLHVCLKVNCLQVMLLVATCLHSCLQQASRARCLPFNVVGEFLTELALQVDGIFVPGPKLDRDKILIAEQLCLAFQSFANVLSCSSSIDAPLVSNVGDSAAVLEPSSVDVVINSVFYAVDISIIPSAVRVWLKACCNEVGIAFFQMLASVLDLDRSKGELLSRKLAESSFLRITTDFRCSVAHSQRKEVDGVLSTVQSSLCRSLEDDVWPEEELHCFLDALSHFNIASSEWQLFLLETPCTIEHEEIMYQTYMCIFGLLAFSCRANDPFLALPLVANMYHKFAQNVDKLLKLSLAGKRYFIYGWIHSCKYACQPLEIDKAMQNMSDLLVLFVDQAEKLYMHSDFFLVWILSLQCPEHISAKYAELFLRRFACNKAGLSTGKLSEALISTGLVGKAVNVLVLLLLTCIVADVTEVCLRILQDLFGDRKAALHLQETAQKLFLCSYDALPPENTENLFRLLNMYLVSNDCALADGDMKLFCRALSLSFAVPNSRLLLEVLNYMYIVISRAIQLQNCSPVSIILSNYQVFNELEKRIFFNKNLLAYALGSDVIEQICAAWVLLFSQVVLALHILNVTTAGREAVRILKNNCVALIQHHRTPVLQLSVLRFWSALFLVKCKSPIVSFIDGSGEPGTVTERDIELVLIGLQNVICSRSKLAVKFAAECFKGLHESHSRPNVLASRPWNAVLLEYCIELMDANTDNSAICSILHVLVRYRSWLSSNFLDACANVSERIVTSNTATAGVNFLPVLDAIMSRHSMHVSERQAACFLKLSGFLHPRLDRANVPLDPKHGFFSLNGVLILNTETPMEGSSLVLCLNSINSVLRTKVSNDNAVSRTAV